MRPLLKRNVRWIKFVVKVSGYVAIANLSVMPILWILNILSPVVLVYEGVFLVFLGGVQWLLSLIYYRKNYHSAIDQTYPYPGPSMLDHKRIFKRLSPEERERYRQEGIIMVIIGLILWTIAIVVSLLNVIH